jgi:hypothetical protein
MYHKYNTHIAIENIQQLVIYSFSKFCLPIQLPANKRCHLYPNLQEIDILK